MTYQWKKPAARIVDDISEEFNLGWDTDSNIFLLIQWIEENCDPAAFERFVRAIAQEESQMQHGSWSEEETTAEAKGEHE